MIQENSEVPSHMMMLGWLSAMHRIIAVFGQEGLHISYLVEAMAGLGVKSYAVWGLATTLKAQGKITKVDDYYVSMRKPK